MEIYLCRHGQNVDNANGILNGRRDLPLTALGESQAFSMGDRIREAGLSFDLICSSPLQRAKRTAETIAERIGYHGEIRVMDLLVERDFGVMTGIEQARIKELCSPDIIETSTVTYFLHPEGSESFPELIKRASSLLEEVRGLKVERVLLVTHGDIGKMIYAAYYNLPWRQVLTDFHFGNTDLLLMSENSPADQAHVFKVEQHNH